MSDASAIFERYQTAAMDLSNKRMNSNNVLGWGVEEAAEFRELKGLLLPHANAGHVLCQYAMASILWMGFCCESEAEHKAQYATSVNDATHWWLAAAQQGFWPAIDNLITDGTGDESKRARDEFRKLEQDRRDLVAMANGRLIHGTEFMQELSRRLYGKVINNT
jgi:hypothetical protein